MNLTYGTSTDDPTQTSGPTLNEFSNLVSGTSPSPSIKDGINRLGITTPNIPTIGWAQSQIPSSSTLVSAANAAGINITQRCFLQLMIQQGFGVNP